MPRLWLRGTGVQTVEGVHMAVCRAQSGALPLGGLGCRIVNLGKLTCWVATLYLDVHPRDRRFQGRVVSH